MSNDITLQFAKVLPFHKRTCLRACFDGFGFLFQSFQIDRLVSVNPMWFWHLNFELITPLFLGTSVYVSTICLNHHQGECREISWFNWLHLICSRRSTGYFKLLHQRLAWGCPGLSPQNRLLSPEIMAEGISLALFS